MDKVKKFLFVPFIYHVLLLGALIVLNAKGLTSIMTVLAIELLIGGIVTPAFFAFVSMIHAIFHEAKVYDYIYKCLMHLVVIGVIRLVVYIVCAGGKIGVLVSLACILVSVGVFTLWACLFALLDRFMKKRPSRNKKK